MAIDGSQKMVDFPLCNRLLEANSHCGVNDPFCGNLPTKMGKIFAPNTEYPYTINPRDSNTSGSSMGFQKDKISVPKHMEHAHQAHQIDFVID